MPRFDKEGFNPNKRIHNDEKDRSVPVDENYYANGESDFDLYDKYNGEVVDRQNSVDINEYLNSFEPPVRSERQRQEHFVPEMARDFDRERRRDNQRNADKRQASKHKSKPQKPKRRKSASPFKKILLAIIAIILAIVILVVGLINGVLGKITYDEKRDNEYVASSDLHDNMMVKNILLLGVDARTGENGNESRADSMMIVSVDMKHKCIKMVSFLRDSWVKIPAIDGEQRLNAACAYDGYSGVKDTIEYNFGVKIDGYVVVDFEMFKVLVDSIGGVKIDVTKEEAKEVTNHKKRYGNVKLEAGEQKLNGEQALAYSRIRKIDSDFMRAKRQRTVMQSILSSVKSGNPFKLYKMARGSAPYIETDLTKSQLKRLAISAVMSLSGDMVETRVPFDGTWDYAYISGCSVIRIDAEKNKEKLIEYLYKMSAEEIKAQEKD